MAGKEDAKGHVSNTVDVKDASYTNSIGDAELAPPQGVYQIGDV